MFGIGALLPWNAVLTALDFFFQSYPNKDPAFVFGLTLNAPNFLFNFVNIFAAKWISLKIRLIVSLIFIFILTWSMPLIAQYTDGEGSWYFILAVIGKFYY